MSGALCLTGVRIDVASRALIEPLDLTIKPGECVTLMGPSGSGKSTLLAHIAGTLDPAFRGRGRFFIGGDEITHVAPQARGIGIQFQDDLLFPHLSVGGNLAFALPSDIRGREARRAAVEQALREADLEGFADRDPATLSGGQRARVALMRTLLAKPRALLLDEPFSKLDTALRSDVRRFVFEHAAERGLPALLVTHDETDARAAGGPVLMLTAAR
ncbi:MAG TPA: ATP-binding cassette domain-containing protein [Casimicrobiaceae bacterium]|nr:ATP-binding cassette domain-containing protein [Casimicrobiaceae bacterium]